MDRYSKSQKKKLRQLKDIAYERELDQELSELYKDFQKWWNKEIDGFELNGLIHKYHQGSLRGVGKHTIIWIFIWWFHVPLLWDF